MVGVDICINNNQLIKYAVGGIYTNKNDPPLILKLLIDHGVDIHVDTDFPICYAVYCNHFENVKLLLSAGANINNSFVLKIAVQNFNISMVEYLLDSGADADCGALSMAIYYAS